MIKNNNVNNSNWVARFPFSQAMTERLVFVLIQPFNAIYVFVQEEVNGHSSFFA